MNGLTFTTQEGCVPEDVFKNHLDTLLAYKSRLGEIVEMRDFDTDEASILLPDADRGVVEAALHSFKQKRVRYVIVVGIGGSNLGTQALYEALLGDSYIASPDAPKMLFLDTTDSRNTAKVLSRLSQDVSDPEEMVINIISKSGGTTETIANFEVLYKELSTHFGDITAQVVVTTDQGSQLWVQAEAAGLLVLPVPKKVGGRYSVFSSVGLFPLGVCGINIETLLQGALDARSRCVDVEGMENPALMSAAIQYEHARKGIRIHNTFFFNPELETLGKWYRQLVGESLGKEKDREGKEVHQGITPIISIGSTDLHSMAQLYLGGPRDKMTTFVYAKASNEGLQVPKGGVFDIVPGISNRGLTDIMVAIYEGVKTAYRKASLPYLECEIDELSEYTLGAFMQMKMMEVMYLAELMNVNAFDQPSVELYKEETRTLLLAAEKNSQ